MVAKNKNKESDNFEYNSELLQRRTFFDVLEKTYIVTKSNNTMMTYKQIEKYYKILEKESQNTGKRFRLRAEFPDGYKTIKTMDGSLLSEEDFEDYVRGAVRDVDKFTEAWQLEVDIIEKLDKTKSIFTKKNK